MNELKNQEYLWGDSLVDALYDFVESSHRQGYHDEWEIVSAFCRENDISYSLVGELIQLAKEEEVL